MIDSDPTDLTCIDSTLHYICDESKRNGVTPIVTFDLPLWWKAFTVIESEPENSQLKTIVLQLGSFHTSMSFLGSIGHLMFGS